MAQNVIVGTDTVKDALLTNTNNDFTELFALYAALSAGSGVLVSSDDGNIGYLNGKLLAGDNITFTEGTPGGDETLTIDVTQGVMTAGTNITLTAGSSILTISSEGKDVLAKTADYTITTSDLGKVIQVTAAGDTTQTLPSVGSTQNGFEIWFTKLGAGKMIISRADSDTVADAGVTIYNNTAAETYATLGLQYVHSATNWAIVGGHGTWVTTDS
jgi:hypothetical protein